MDKDNVIFLLRFIIPIAIMFVIVLALAWTPRKYDYQYIDIDGNTGLSTNCYLSDSALFCNVNGGKIMVKQYQEDK